MGQQNSVLSDTNETMKKKKRTKSELKKVK